MKITDKMRLDYMARNKFYPFCFKERGSWGNTHDIFKAPFSGPRQAIDAAILQERRKKL